MLWTTARMGPGVSPDSAGYLLCAESLIKGEGFASINDPDYVYWPPLYPMTLAGVRWLGHGALNALDAARGLNAVLFGLIVLQSGLLLRRHVESDRLALVGSLVPLVASPLLHVSVFVWSEPLFISLTLTFLVVATWGGDRTSLRRAALLGSIAGLAALTRYIGVSLIATGVVILTLDGVRRLAGVRSKASVRAIALSVSIFVVSSSIPLALWFARNYAVAKTLTGVRFSTLRDLWSNVHISAMVLLKWISPATIPPVPAVIVLGLLVLGMLLVLFGPRRRSGSDAASPRAGVEARPFALAAFAFIYVAWLAASASLLHFDIINDRLLSPVYVPGLILVLSSMERAWIGATTRAKRADLAALGTRLALPLGLAGWLALYPAASALKSLPSWRNNGLSLASVAWREDPLGIWLRDHPPNGMIETNGPDAVYILSGLRSNTLSMGPRRLAEIDRAMRSGVRVYVVYFDRVRRPYLPPVRSVYDVLASRFTVRTLYAADAGVVWELFPRLM